MTVEEIKEAVRLTKQYTTLIPDSTDRVIINFTLDQLANELIAARESNVTRSPEKRPSHD
jgi:hypothetical protein